MFRSSNLELFSVLVRGPRGRPGQQGVVVVLRVGQEDPGAEPAPDEDKVLLQDPGEEVNLVQEVY